MLPFWYKKNKWNKMVVAEALSKSIVFYDLLKLALLRRKNDFFAFVLLYFSSTFLQVKMG